VWSRQPPLGEGVFHAAEGTTVTFYTLAAKLVHQKDTQAIVAGQPDLKSARIVEEYRGCPET